MFRIEERTIYCGGIINCEQIRNGRRSNIKRYDQIISTSNFHLGFSRSLNIDEKEIKRFYKILLRERASIYDKLSVTGQTQRKSIIDEVKELIESFCNKLQQPFQVVKQAKEVAVKSIAALEGKRPSSVAAAAILFILTLMNASPKQQELAEVAGISTNTLRNVFKELTKNIDDIPKVPDMKATVIASYVAVQ